MTGNNGIKKRKKKYLSLILITAILFFVNISLPLAAVFYAVFSMTNQTKNQKTIINECSFLCKGNSFAYYNLQINHLHLNSEIDYKKSVFENFAKRTFSDVLRFDVYDCFLATDSAIYLLATESYKGNFKKTCLYSTDYYLSQLDRLCVLKEYNGSQTIDASFGFDNNGYFRIGDSYYHYSFDTLSFKEIPASSKNTNKVFFESYLSSLLIETGEFKYKQTCVEHFYDKQAYIFDERNIIDINLINLLKKYHFSPSGYYSFPSGITSIVYYGNRDRLTGIGDSIIISYDRCTNTFLESQLFTSVSVNYFKKSRLLPKIVFESNL
ncbi:MAG: hypothetical protein J6N95_02075 [Bacilli bacterium]|nr:hypothetical protein [Bacilli bacterium]